MHKMVLGLIELLLQLYLVQTIITLGITVYMYICMSEVELLLNIT